MLKLGLQGGLHGGLHFCYKLLMHAFIYWLDISFICLTV